MSATTVGASLQWASTNHSALHVPIRSPASVVEEIRRWQTGIPPIDTGELPATHESIYPLVGITEKRATTSDRYLPNSIDVDHVTHVKVGIGIPIFLAESIQDESVAVSDPRKTTRRQTRSIIHGMRQRVVEIERQLVSQTFAYRDGTGVIGRVADAAKRRESPILRIKEQVATDCSVNDVLSIGPVVTIKPLRNRVHCLGLISTLVDAKRFRIATAGISKIKIVGQSGEVRRKEVRKPRDLRNGRDRSTVRAQVFKWARRGVPIHSRLRIHEVVERHDVSLREQLTAQPADIRRLQHEALRQLAFERGIPTVVYWRYQRFIQSRFDAARIVCWFLLRECQRAGKSYLRQAAHILSKTSKQRSRTSRDVKGVC